MTAQILICVGGLTVHRGADGAILFSVQEYVKEGELTVGLPLYRELYARVDTVQMVMEGVHPCLAAWLCSGTLSRELARAQAREPEVDGITPMSLCNIRTVRA